MSYFSTPSPTERNVDREISGQEALEGFVSGLYTEVFNCVVALINRYHKLFSKKKKNVFMYFLRC